MEVIINANEQIKKRPNMFHAKNNRFGQFSIINNDLVYIDKYTDIPVKATDFGEYETSGICEGATNMMFLNELKKSILKELK